MGEVGTHPINLPVDSGENRDGNVNVNDIDNDSDSDSDGVDLELHNPDGPPNRAGAEIEDETSGKEKRLIPDFNYNTTSRWAKRMSLWQEFMANTSEQKALPTEEEFFYSKDPKGDKNSVEYLIWGVGEDSLKSLHSTLLQNDNSYQMERFSVESGRVDHEEPEAFETPSDLDANPIIRRLVEKLKKADQRTIKAIEGRIKEKEARINAELARIWERHDKTRLALSALAKKGNESAGSRSTGRTESRDGKRIDKSAAPQPSEILEIGSTKSDPNFLKELLEKEKILCVDTNNLLCELREFVAKLLEQADVVTKKDKDSGTRKIQQTADAILEWTPGRTVESLGQIAGNFGRPSSKGCETTADQPLFCALIFKMLAILEQSSTSVSSEQSLAYVEKARRHRRIDFIVDEYREFLHVLFPEKLGRAIEVKSPAMDVKALLKGDYGAFEKNQEQAREQVIGHLAKQLLCSFDFGGIGQNDIVCGVVLSMVSIQVLEMRLTKIGTNEVKLVFRQTPHVPLFRRFELPQGIQTEFDWDMDSNGVLLLAGAMLDIPRMSLFGEQIKCTVDDESAKNFFSNSEEARKHTGIEIQSLLGSGSFAHVVQLDNNAFMKVPRSRRMVRSLQRECEKLTMLDPGVNEGWIPKTMPWGVSVVNLFIRNEISQMEVLRLTGIVGVSLGTYCKNRSLADHYIHTVIHEVYKALRYAHSKNIVHMDVRPSNIVVKVKLEGNKTVLDVLLADWGCSLSHEETIERGKFIGCTPYAHDKLLGERTNKLRPKHEFDFASLGYTWYHSIMGKIGWEFDRPQQVTDVHLQKRRMLMEKFFNDNKDGGTGDAVPKVFKIFVPSKKRPIYETTR